MKLMIFISPLHFEEYRYRCSVCNKELLVNEAIVDAGIGMEKFNNVLNLLFKALSTVQI